MDAAFYLHVLDLIVMSGWKVRHYVCY